MAGELKHSTVGSEMSQSEWESISVHTLDGGIAGDIIYYNGSNLIRLAIGSTSQVLTVVGGIPAWAAGSSGTFLGLTDVIPGSYSGQGGKFCVVKGDESGIEFTAASPAGAFTDLSDTPGNYTSAAGKLLRVNTTPDGVEYINLAIGTDLFIAASGASAAAKAGALATGATICSGANDESDVLTHTAAVGAGGLVSLSTKTFNIQAAMSLNFEGTLKGMGPRHSILNITPTNVGITLTNTYAAWPGMTRLHNVSIHTPTGYTADALTVRSLGPLWNIPQILSNIFCYAYNGEITGVGIKIYQYSNASGNEESIAFCTFDNIHVRGYERCLYWYVYRRTSGSAYFNNNSWDKLFLGRGKYIFDAEINGDGTYEYNSIGGNKVTELGIQPHWTLNNTDYGIRHIQGGGGGSEILFQNRHNIFIWDWALAEFQAIYLCAGSEYNEYEGHWPNTYGEAEQIYDPSGLNIFNNDTRDLKIIGAPGNPGYYEVWGDAVGQQQIAGQAGLDFGDLVYKDPADSGKWKQTDADAEGTSKGPLGIILTITPADDGNITVLRRGNIDVNTWSFTNGNLVYVSTTAGGVTDTAPAGSGDVVRIIGEANGSDAIYFNPDYYYTVNP